MSRQASTTPLADPVIQQPCLTWWATSFRLWRMWGTARCVAGGPLPPSLRIKSVILNEVKDPSTAQVLRQPQAFRSAIDFSSRPAWWSTPARLWRMWGTTSSHRATLRRAPYSNLPVKAGGPHPPSFGECGGTTSTQGEHNGLLFKLRRANGRTLLSKLWSVCTRPRPHPACLRRKHPAGT